MHSDETEKSAEAPGDPNTVGKSRITPGGLIKIKKKARQRAFLKAFVLIGTVSGAARKVGIAQQLHAWWMNNDPEYPARFESTVEAAIDIAEEELRSRGIDGVQEPVYYRGEKIDTVTKKSDACLMFYLRGRRSEVFKDRVEMGADANLAQTLAEKLMAGRQRAAERAQKALPAGITEGVVIPPHE